MHKSFHGTEMGAHKMTWSPKGAKPWEHKSYDTDPQGRPEVHKGGKVIFSPNDCYIKYPGGRRDRLEQRDGLYIMRMWVPKNQGQPFPGQP